MLNRVHATPLPMPDDVIKRVETLARRQHANPGLVFGNREQQPINDLDDNITTKKLMMLTMSMMMESRMTVNLMKIMNMQVRMMRRRNTMRTVRIRMTGMTMISMRQLQNQPSKRWMHLIPEIQTRHTMINT